MTPTKTALYASRKRVQNQAFPVDAPDIYDYLSEIARSSVAKLLTANTLLMIFEKSFLIRLLGFGAKLVTGALLATIAGCAFLQREPVREIKAVEVAAPAKPTALTEEAETALKAAEESVTEARAKRALWTAAVEQLAKAREAAKVFDSAATLTHSKEVVALCALSLQQLSAPPVKW